MRRSNPLDFFSAPYARKGEKNKKVIHTVHTESDFQRERERAREQAGLDTRHHVAVSHSTASMRACAWFV